MKDKQVEVASAYSLTILGALQKRPMYAGTVPPHVKAQRRAKDKRASASRRANRCR